MNISVRHFSIRLVLLLSMTASTLSAQKYAIKGRVAALPAGGLTAFSLGIGLERRIGDDFSLQFLYNRMGSDMRRTDGGATVINAFVPEFRYYFGNKKATSINRAFFCSVFTELNKIKYLSGGETAPSDDGSYRHERTSINPGFLIGKNARLSDRWYLEFYTGGKVRFFKETGTIVENGISTTTETRSVRAGMRGGINLGWRF